MKSFGSDFSGTLGYYRTKWFLAGEVGFDKAIVTNLKHSQSYREIYPDVTDGWYSPPSGGNFYYGLQAGFSFKQHDIYVKAGKIITQDFKTEPRVPFFAQIGYNFRIKCNTRISMDKKKKLEFLIFWVIRIVSLILL